MAIPSRPSGGVGRRVAAMGLLLLVFAAGGVLGFVLGHRVAADAPEAVAAETETEEDPRRRALIHRLDLTDEQQVQVDSILQHHRSEWREIQREVGPRYRGMVSETREGLRSVLTPEQRALYDSLLADAQRGSQRGDRP